MSRLVMTDGNEPDGLTRERGRFSLASPLKRTSLESGSVETEHHAVRTSLFQVPSLQKEVCGGSQSNVARFESS